MPSLKATREALRLRSTAGFDLTDQSHELRHIVVPRHDDVDAALGKGLLVQTGVDAAARRATDHTNRRGTVGTQIPACSVRAMISSCSALLRSQK